MKITWIGHSCFKIEKGGYSIVIDPYEAGYVPGLRPVGVSANEVICTHEHGDHNGRSEVSLAETDSLKSPFCVEIISTYHDEVKGAKRGKNNIILISDGKQRVAHLGDLGCDPTPEQKAELTGLDLIMVPVGGCYTIDGTQAADLMKELNPKHIIPMHFRDDQVGFGFKEISQVDAFTKHMDSVMQIGASDVDLTKEYEAQVLILQAANASNH